MNKAILSIVSILFVVSAYCSGSNTGELPADDVVAIKALNEAYVEGWRKNDPEQVMKVFAADAVLIPQGGSAVKGLDAIRKFYWPEGGAATKIAQFTITTEEAGGSQDFAYVRGTYSFSIQFMMKGVMTPRPNEGNYLMLFRRMDDGHWLVTHRMWAQLQ